MYKVEQITNNDSNNGSDCVVMNINTFREDGLSSVKTRNVENNKEKLTQPRP